MDPIATRHPFWVVQCSLVACRDSPWDLGWWWWMSSSCVLVGGFVYIGILMTISHFVFTSTPAEIRALKGTNTSAANTPLSILSGLRKTHPMIQRWLQRPRCPDPLCLSRPTLNPCMYWHLFTCCADETDALRDSWGCSGCFSPSCVLFAVRIYANSMSINMVSLME